jgi:hypothetical protein
MADLEELNQIKLLAELLASMPPQEGSTQRINVGIPAKRVQWATELVREFGVRVHPELATKVLVDDGDGPLAGNASKRSEDVLDMDELLDILRGFPEVPSLKQLADNIEAAKGDPNREAALRNVIRKQYPDIVATAKHIADRTPPDQYEKQG